MRFIDNSSVHGDDYDIKVTLAGHLLLDSVRPRHCCEVWSFLMLEGWRGGVAGADIRSDQVMYSDWCLQNTVMNIKINQSIIASTPLAKKLYTVLMEILFYAHWQWQTQQNTSILTFSNGAKKNHFCWIFIKLLLFSAVKFSATFGNAIWSIPKGAESVNNNPIHFSGLCLQLPPGS